MSIIVLEKTSPLQKRQPILGLDAEQLKSWLDVQGQPAYRANQLFQWIHRLGELDFQAMNNLSKPLRQLLQDHASLQLPEIIYEREAADGTCKWLLRLDDGNAIETVFIPERERGTLCVSSQVGCSLNCSFCSTGKQGFNRHLTTAEIIAQVWIAVRRLKPVNKELKHPVTNVVMMGMGEPLLNYAAVLPALNLMLDDQAYGLSKYRVTLSTAGVVPAMLRLKQDSPVALAVSLHAPNDELRDQLVPLNKKYPLKELIPVCRDYFAGSLKRRVTFEYVMLDGVNDQPQHAEQLIRLLRDVPCKINLIPFNPFPGNRYQRSAPAVIESFQLRLMNAGYNTRVRRTRGEDIDAACGQLAGQFADRTGRHNRWLRTGSLVTASDEGKVMASDEGKL